MFSLYWELGCRKQYEFYYQYSTKHEKIYLFLAAIASLVGCSPKNDARGAVNHEKCLVVYYSQTGAMAKVAQEIRRQTGIDTLRIEADNPYNGNFNETIARCQKEMANTSSL